MKFPLDDAAPALDDELTTVRTVLEADGRAVIVVGVVLKDQYGLVGRSASHPATRRQALVFAAALEREAQRLRNLAEKAPAL